MARSNMLTSNNIRAICVLVVFIFFGCSNHGPTRRLNNLDKTTVKVPAQSDSIAGDSLYKLGLSKFEADTSDPQFEEGRRLLMMAVTSGNISAMRFLGTELLKGFVIRKNERLGISILKEAVFKKDGAASIVLSDYFFLHHLTDSVIKYINMGITFGDTDALYCMALLKINGRFSFDVLGFDDSIAENLIDKCRGYALMSKAASLGHLDAEIFLGEKFLQGDSPCIQVDSAKAKRYLFLAYTDNRIAAIAGRSDDIELFLTGYFTDKWKQWLYSGQNKIH